MNMAGITYFGGDGGISTEGPGCELLGEISGDSIFSSLSNTN